MVFLEIVVVSVSKISSNRNVDRFNRLLFRERVIHIL